MRAIVQRVKYTQLSIEGSIHSKIDQGLLVLVGIESSDNEDDIQWLASKLTNMRIFSDADGKMNHSVQDINGEMMIVSQFTLFASTKKGNRPSFLQSAKPEQAIPIYETLIAALRDLMPNRISTGVFGADMKIALENDGPVTICIDTKVKE